MVVSSSPNSLTLKLYQCQQSVFTIAEIALISGIANARLIVRRMQYAVAKGLFVSPRAGIYAKPDYSASELANRLYAPSYVSLEYVLGKAGVIFQYDSRVTLCSYVSRTVSVDENEFSYRRLKPALLGNFSGIKFGRISEAEPERAFLDMLYLNRNCEFDNISALNKDRVLQLLPIYGSETINRRALKFLSRV